MFSDGFESIGLISSSSEKEPSQTQLIIKKFKTAIKDRDWRLVINILDDWPDASVFSEEDKNNLSKSLLSLHSLIEKRNKQGKVFSSESLSDLSSDLAEALRKVEGK